MLPVGPAGTLGDGLADFASKTGLSVSNWSVELDKLKSKNDYIVNVKGKLTNNNKTTKNLNWRWFLIRKEGQNTIPPTLEAIFGSLDFSILPGNSTDMNLTFEIPRLDDPSSYQMLVKTSDGTLLPVSSLGGFTEVTDYSILTDSTSFGGEDGFQQALAADFITAVDYFLAHGKSAKDIDAKGEPALKYTIDSHDATLVELIIKAGTDVFRELNGCSKSARSILNSTLRFTTICGTVHRR